MRVNLLGPVELWSDGAPVAGPSKQRLVLALLASRVGRPLLQTELIDALWGDRPPTSAANNLRTYVAGLRRTLGAEALVRSTSLAYTLRLSTDHIDMHEFLALVSGGQAALEADDAAGAHRDLSAALRLWRGTPFSEFADVDVLAGQSSMLSERRLLAIESRIEADLRLGHCVDLTAELIGLIGEHPYRERLRGHLMLALYRAGRQADALAAYRDTCTVLRRDLGIEPGADLRQLEQAILRHDAGLRPPPQRERVCVVVAAQSPPGADQPTMTGGPTAGSPRVVFVDLRGFHPGPPVPPADALARLLRMLGVPDRLIPAAIDDAAALHRSLPAEERVLVVLDAGARQVRPSPPGGPGWSRPRRRRSSRRSVRRRPG